MTTRRMHVIIYGLVQGVFFRETVRKEAVHNGLSGWIKNCRDGSVEAVLEGSATQVGEMLVWLHHGVSLARVDKVTCWEEEPLRERTGFSIRFD